MVLNILGAEQTAYYYISFAIASLLYMIPNAVSMSLFVEGSHGAALKKTTVKSLIAIFSLLIPAVFILYFSGGWVLGIIGKNYCANGLELLRIMVIASLFKVVTSIYFSIKRVHKEVKGLIFLSALIFILVVGLSYVLIIEFGIVGAGYAWMVGYGLGSLIVGGIVWREGWV